MLLLTSHFEKTNSRADVSPLLFETPQWESLDIDEEDDFSFVSLVLQAMEKSYT